MPEFCRTYGQPERNKKLNWSLWQLIPIILLLFAFNTSVFASPAITLASFKGNYAGFVTGVGGKEPVAITGILTFNGDGTGSAVTLWHLPGPNFIDRLNIPRDFPFTYQVDDKGIVLVKAETFADLYFVITKSRKARQGNHLLAVEIQGMAGRLETSAGSIVVGTGKRLPTHARFDKSSISGIYSGTGVGDNRRLVTSVGYSTFNGDGTGEGRSLWNVPDPLHVFERQLTPITSKVSYHIAPNGIGLAQVVQDTGRKGRIWFVVTETERKRGKYIATELFIIQDQVNPVTGDLISGFMHRLQLSR